MNDVTKNVTKTTQESAYRATARQFLMVHDSFQNVFVTGGITFNEFNELQAEYRGKVEHYLALAEISKAGTQKDATWEEFYWAFLNDGRTCKFSYDALEGIYKHLRYMSKRGEQDSELVELDVEGLTNGWEEYNSLALAAGARFSAENWAFKGITTPDLEDLRNYCLVLELGNGRLAVWDY